MFTELLRPLVARANGGVRVVPAVRVGNNAFSVVGTIGALRFAHLL